MKKEHLKCVSDEDYIRKAEMIDYIEPIYPLVEPHVTYCFAAKDGYEFEFIKKGGEMGWIIWVQIKKEGELFAEIREANCNIFYKKGIFV